MKTKKDYCIESALSFQMNGKLIINPVTFQIAYDVIDVNSQIIESCEFIQQPPSGAIDNFKLIVERKGNTLLTLDELDKFKRYIDSLITPFMSVEIENK